MRSPVSTARPGATAPRSGAPAARSAGTMHRELREADLSVLRQRRPDLVQQLEGEALAGNVEQQRVAAAAAETKRLADLADLKGDPDLDPYLPAAMRDGTKTAGALALAIVKGGKAAGLAYLRSEPAPVAPPAHPAPTSGGRFQLSRKGVQEMDDTTGEPIDAAEEMATLKARKVSGAASAGAGSVRADAETPSAEDWDRDPDLRSEFKGDRGAFDAFLAATEKGLVGNMAHGAGNTTRGRMFQGLGAK